MIWQNSMEKYSILHPKFYTNQERNMFGRHRCVISVVLKKKISHLFESFCPGVMSVCI